MAFSKARRLSDFIAADGSIPTGKFASSTITSAHLVDGTIAHADLHTNMDLTGKTVLVANASTGDSDTTVANTAFVQQELAALVDSAPGTLNTLNELAAALGDDAAFSTTVTNSIATKAPLASPDFTGQLQVTNSATTVQELIVTGNNTRSALSVQSKDSSGNAVDLRMHSLGDGPRGEIFTFTNHDLAFSTNNASPQITLQTSGNFGIGKSPGSVRLDVTTPLSGNLAGMFVNTHATGSYGVKIQAGSSSSNYSFQVANKDDSVDFLTVLGDGNVGYSGKLFSSNVPGTLSGLQLYRNHANGECFLFDTTAAGPYDGPLIFGTSNTEAMRIKEGNGFVGIGGGTATNPRYNLTVAGNNSKAIGIGLDNASGSSTLDIAALGTGYTNHQAAAGEVWFYSPDNINIGGATGTTNDIKFIADNKINMVIKGNGYVGIGELTTASNGVPSAVNANLQIHGNANANGNDQLVLIKNTTTATYNEAAFVGTGRGMDFITNSNAEGDFTAIRFANVGGSRETAIGVVQNDNTTLDSTGQGDVVIQGYDGDRYSETQRFSANGSHIQKGQSRTGGYTSFALINHTYTFDHNNYASAGTPSNTNEHWLEVPLYSQYSTSQGGGWVEIDICWHAVHAQAGHLHSYKLLWGSHHSRILNVNVISATASATTGSYAPYRFTSSSALYRHPTAGDAYMKKMYIQIKGSTNHSGSRSITLRGCAHPLHPNIGPIIDHAGDSTPDGITPAVVNSPITVFG